MKAKIAFAACTVAILAGCGGRAPLTPEQITASLIKQNTTLVSYGVPAECFNPQPTGKEDTLRPDLDETAQLQCRGAIVAARRQMRGERLDRELKRAELQRLQTQTQKSDKGFSCIHLGRFTHCN